MVQAITIYRGVLDALTGHIVRGDGHSCLQWLALPFRMHLLDQTHVCTTGNDVVHVIRHYHALMHDRGVTDLRRTTEDARFLSPKMIEGFHTTAPLRNGVPVVEPYATKTILEQKKGRWVAAEQEVIANTKDWPIMPDPASSHLPHPRVAQ